MKNGIRYLATLSALVLMSSAQAASITVTDNWETLDSRSINGEFDNLLLTYRAGDTVSLPKFDTSLGNLDKAFIQFSGMTITTRAANSFRDDDWLSEVKGNTEIRDPRIVVNSSPGFDGFTRNGNERQDTCSDTGGFTSGASCSTSLPEWTQTGIVTYITGGDLAAFSGPGSFDFTIWGEMSHWSNEYDGDDGYVNMYSAMIRTNGTVSVTYHYTEVVPVPAAVWLFGSALGLLGWMRRKTM